MIRGRLTPVPTLELPRDEAHLWHVDPDSVRDPGALQAIRDVMTEEESARQRRFRLPRGRQEALVTRGLVRTCLSQYARVDPADWRFETGPHGRPEIASPGEWRHLRFNLSHTRGRVVCLVAWQVDVGADVEEIDRGGRLLDVARRYFSAEEADALFALPAPEQISRFFDYWTLKESYIKARGMGLALPLAHFSFSISSGAPVRIRFAPELEDDPRAWQFELCDLSPRHRAAVALRGGGTGFKLRIASASRLLRGGPY